MQIQLFTISVSDDGSAAEGLNRFLRSHRVLAVDQQLAVVGGSPCWCFCVRYLDHRGGVEGGNKP